MPPPSQGPPSTPDLLCPARGRQIEQAWALRHQGDHRAFLEMAGSIYDWLDRRVAAILRGYPGVGLPPDEVLSDYVMDRIDRSLGRNEAASCEEFTRLVSGEIRWAIRSALRDQARQRGRTSSLESIAPEDGDADWLADPRAANPLEDLLTRQEGERFAQARARFDDAAASLPEPLRQAFCLRYYAGLPVEEVAMETGVTGKTVRHRVKEALDAISQQLTGRPFPGKPPQFKGKGDAAEATSFCRTDGEGGVETGPG